MTDHDREIISKLLDNQKDLISAFARARTPEEISVLEAIAETQYMIVEAMMPEVEITLVDGDSGPVTIQ